VTSLLPPASDIRLHYRRVVLEDKTMSRYDAVLIACMERNADNLVKRLPHASMWRKLKTLSHREDTRPPLHARLPNDSLTAMTIGFAKADATPFALLSIAGKLVKEFQLANYRRVLLATSGFDEAQAAVVQEALLAALLAAAAALPTFKSKAAPRAALREITLAPGHVKRALATTVATDAGNHLARWLTTLPPNRLNCATYARALRTLAKSQGWRFQFFGEAALKRAGAGAFLAVARANAHRSAGIVKLSYRPNRKKSRHIALVGKGICFDTGGINLKAHKSMYHMHEDMMGSAVAVGTLLALTELAAPFAIDCWVALTENEIGPQAYRPQEVVTAANGVTIQVAHSDAEGRMALADALALASRDRPDLILDFATLTGACVGALTERMSGVFTNRDAWRAGLEQAGKTSGERVWSFPMDEDYDTDLDSQVADILQCTPDSKGDHILAARFLARFVGKDIGWVHVDLASSNRAGGLAHIPTDCTGFGVRFAVQLLLHEGLGSGAWDVGKKKD
jgi:leucyl aminopeptidase